MLLLQLVAVTLMAQAQDLESHRDPALENSLHALIQDVSQGPFNHCENRATIALVDLTPPLRFAGFQESRMMYVASIAKLGILAGIFRAVDEEGLDPEEIRDDLEVMIRDSSNPAATRLWRLLGGRYLEETLVTKGLFSLARNEGLWVGRDYGSASGAEVYRRIFREDLPSDEIQDISHGGTALSIANFYFDLAQGRRWSLKSRQQMLDHLSRSRIENRFWIIKKTYPAAQVFRKSGSWTHETYGPYWGDSAWINNGKKSYIFVANTVKCPKGKEWLEKLILGVDDLLNSAAKINGDHLWQKKEPPTEENPT